jgi:hypothetical protein
MEGKVMRAGARERGQRTSFQIVEALPWHAEASRRRQAALAQFAEIANDLKK